MLALVLLLATPALAAPPEYASFGREQRLAYTPNAGDLLRIWVVYVGQGDGILIQLPERLSYDAGDGDGQRERIDIMIDGGTCENALRSAMVDFLGELYADGTPCVEHAVITHHDQDHVLGLGEVLEAPNIEVQHIYHNGLASFVAGARGLPGNGEPSRPAVYETTDDGDIKRALGLLVGDTDAFDTRYVMDDLAELRTSVERRELHGVYANLAREIVEKTAPTGVAAFHRAAVDRPFIPDIESSVRAGLGDIQIEVIGPPSQVRRYGDWGETINGDSVTFRLTYRDFSMLFTGDHNEKSEQALLDALEASGGTDVLEADVLKVPHHGSKHGIQAFFDAVAPVISVASQGPQGAKSKKLSGSRAWQHPANEVVQWLGGAHRVYLTELHERRFDWEKIDTEPELARLKEQTHVLIETDGAWFRVVEVSTTAAALVPPTVSQTARSNGTRWIRAR